MVNRRNARIGFLLASTLLSAGCATVGSVSGVATGRVTVPVKFRGSLGDTAFVDGRMVDATVELGAIPGEIFGDRGPGLVTESVNATSAAFELDLDRLTRLSAQKAAVMTQTASDAGWKITPANTRMLRISTDIGLAAHRYRLTTAFADAPSANLLILAYFDRPCHVTGTIQTGRAGRPPHTSAIDVKVKKAGLHWLAANENAYPPASAIAHASGSVIPVFVVRLEPPAPQTTPRAH